MNVVILQPGYLPWLGFFEQMSRCELFVIYDDVQYTKKDWRNRNRIKTDRGAMWLTVPVITKGRFHQLIKDVKIDNSQNWKKQHLKSLELWYKRSPCFGLYYDELKNILEKNRTFLVDLDNEIIFWLAGKLGLKRKMILSSSLNLSSTSRQEKVVEICHKVNAVCMYDGKSSRNFIDTGYFNRHGISVEFQDYRHPYYNQLWLEEQGFISHLSVIDLLFNHGPESLDIITGKKIVPQTDGINWLYPNLSKGKWEKKRQIEKNKQG